MGLLPMDATLSDTANRWRDAADAHVLGPAFLSAQQLQRYPLGCIALPGADLHTNHVPDHADVTLILHVMRYPTRV
ncbi:MAG: hypothetical protein ACK4RZ_17045 [Paracoccaceae bacterium]